MPGDFCGRGLHWGKTTSIDPSRQRLTRKCPDQPIICDFPSKKRLPATSRGQARNCQALNQRLQNWLMNPGVYWKTMIYTLLLPPRLTSPREWQEGAEDRNRPCRHCSLSLRRRPLSLRGPRQSVPGHRRSLKGMRQSLRGTRHSLWESTSSLQGQADIVGSKARLG